MKITVTQQHIDAGLKGSCTKDPVALAVLELGFVRPWVGATRLSFLDRKSRKEHSYLIPWAVQEFMYAFDNSKPVLPFEFELEGV